MPRKRKWTCICEDCGKVEDFDNGADHYASDWHFTDGGDICGACHSDNIKHHRTHQDFLKSKYGRDIPDSY